MFGIKQKLKTRLSRRYHLSRLNRRIKRPFRLGELHGLALSRNERYLYCVYYYDHFLPQQIREHRRYFEEHRRGFGEDAFHSMWFLLFEEFRPNRALEIGVYRGQTITLWKLLSRHLTFECKIACISPFIPAGDSVSRYTEQLDYLQDVKENHVRFDLLLPEFCHHYSTASETKDFISHRQWDLIYIDGNHDYEVVCQDWALCKRALSPHGIIVLDDASLGTDFSPPSFATAGHPGPSRLAAEIDSAEFREIFSVGHNRVFQHLR